MDKEYVNYIIYAVLVICIIYVISRLIGYQSNIMEGLTNPNSNTAGVSSDVAVKLLQNMNEKMKDGFLIGKYKKNYEKLLIELEEWSNLELLSTLFELKINNGLDNDNKNIIKTVNDLSNFKGNLNQIMDYLEAN